MILHESKYARINFDKSGLLIEQVFLPSTADMQTEEFQKEMVIFADFVLKHKAALHLIDNTDLQFIIVPDIQEWMNTQLFTGFEKIVKKVAIILPPHIFSQISIQQTMEEEVALKYDVQYFDSPDVAKAWLLQ